LGVPGLNWQTLFLILFAAAAFAGTPPHSSIAVPKWIAYFAIVVTLSATYSWLAQNSPAESLFATVKNWLFPFATFFLGNRCFRRRSQLWFLILCVAIVSLAQALQALGGAVTDSNLLRHRPKGILTGQANLFGGYLTIYSLLVLFVARTVDIGRLQRLFLIASGLLMAICLVFTLSRGAWLAFVATATLVGLATNRRLVFLLVIAVLIGYRWLPQEASTRTEATLEALQSRSGALEDSIDDSAALRVVQWKSFPEMFLEHPVFGTGLQTYPEQLGSRTGIFRSAHAMLIQIGTEMGLLGVVGYLGLLSSAAIACITRARHAGSASFARYAGLGLLAATISLFILDFTGTRFRANTVTTYFWLLLGSYLAMTDREDAPVEPIEPAESAEPVDRLTAEALR
jgi:O-antigen ligase